MIQQDRGHIVTIASLAGIAPIKFVFIVKHLLYFYRFHCLGHNGSNRLVDYCASKFAAVGFDESLRTELAVRIIVKKEYDIQMTLYIFIGRWT